MIIAEHDSVPIRMKDVADISIGKELRTSAATRDGVETVLGTAMMLIAPIHGPWPRMWLPSWRIFRPFARRCDCRSGLRSHCVIGQSHCHCFRFVGRRTVGDRCAVSLWQLPRCTDHGSRDSLSMLMTITGMVKTGNVAI